MVNISKNIIKRAAENQLYSYLEPNKVVVVYGPRRSGKTTLLRQISDSLRKTESILWLEGEQLTAQRQLSVQDIHQLKQLVGTHTLLIIDEAQAVPNIGLNLKLMVDHIPELKIIVSGSASLSLAQQVGEPLVGRKWTVWVYPLWTREIAQHAGQHELASLLPDLLIYGSYPALWHLPSRSAKEEYLEDLVSTALYRDILALDNVRSSAKIKSLLQLLALQIGQEVSIHELATSLEMGTQTVSRYLDLLEQSFVIMNIRGFSRNLRKEITKTSRYYFYDNGVRNALLNNFNPPDPAIRSDVGALWENWIIMERVKKQAYTGTKANNYFWRTYDQKEIDWIEERGGVLRGYEMSFRPKKIRRAVQAEFLKAYPGSQITNIHSQNYLEFVG